MHLYVISCEFDLDAVRTLCRSTKRSATASFTHVVVFDSASYARFPKSVSGGYQLDDEISANKHIKAKYTYVKSNGSSELRHYNTNAEESIAKSETIR
jgi:hypothetical protein